MPARPDRSSPLEPIRRVPQIRQYASDPVPDEVIDQLLELARWTGSSKNGQPWHFIVVRDHERLRKIAALRPNIGWAAAAPWASRSCSRRGARSARRMTRVA